MTTGTVTVVGGLASAVAFAASLGCSVLWAKRSGRRTVLFVRADRAALNRVALAHAGRRLKFLPVKL